MTQEQQVLYERFVLARWSYKCGSPICDDSEYDALCFYMQENGFADDYLARTYDDDEEPTDLLAKYSLCFSTNIGESSEFLMEERSTSIKPVTNTEGMHSFLSGLGTSSDMMLSLKIDGINIKVLFRDGEIVAARTRGRASDGVDVLEGMKRYFSIWGNPSLLEDCIITGELFVAEKYLPYFRKKFDSTKFKAPRSAAISLIRRPEDYSEQEFSCLSYIVFNVSTLVGSVSSMYTAIECAGLTSPPNMLIPKSIFKSERNIIDSYFDFWLKSLRQQQLDLGLPADGVVLETDIMGGSEVQQNQYSATQLALKFSHWKPSVYYGVVKQILLEQRRAMCSCRVRIEPLITDDGSEAQYINCYNPSYLFKNNLYIGSIVPFERQSGTINVLKIDKGTGE